MKDLVDADADFLAVAARVGERMAVVAAVQEPKVEPGGAFRRGGEGYRSRKRGEPEVRGVVQPQLLESPLEQHRHLAAALWHLDPTQGPLESPKGIGPVDEVDDRSRPDYVQVLEVLVEGAFLPKVGCQAPPAEELKRA